MSMGQASPTPHPSFSVKAPRLRELEAVDSYGPLENLIRGQGIVFGLVQKEGPWARGYGMGDMLVAYEDDVPKDRGLKVSGHCALDSGLGCANTFAPSRAPPSIRARRLCLDLG